MMYSFGHIFSKLSFLIRLEIKKMLTTRQLNSKNHSSVPPHELHLKLHDVCILTR